MIKWFLTQFQKTKKSNSKTNFKILEKGEKQEIIFPLEKQDNKEWRLKKWYIDKGEKVKTGQIICSIENENNQIEFESFITGKMNYFKVEGQKIEKGQIIAEIIGE